MPFAAALSQHPLATHAVGEVVGQVLDGVGEAPDAAIVFVTVPFAGAIEDIAATIRATLAPGALIGATAAGVMAGREGLEGSAAISLFAFSASTRRRAGTGVCHAVSFGSERVGDGWQVTASADVAHPRASLVLLADPFTFPTQAFIDDVTTRAPGLTVVGGLASGAAGPGGNRFVADDRVGSAGAVGLLLPPGLGARPVVSQGFRPIGDPLVVTRAEGGLIDEIAGTAALDQVMTLAEVVSPHDRSLMSRDLHLGVALDERKLDFEPGDFHVHQVLGADHERRAVAIGTDVAVGTTVQFQVRDPESADDDVRGLLADAAGDAALVFSCVGRGTGFFDDSHHDADAVSDHVDGGAVAGMFCAGEIGPIGGVHQVHAMTSSILLLDDVI